MTNVNKNLNQVLSQLGRRMIDIGYVNLSQMQQAAATTTRTKQPLVEILQEITGRPAPLELLSQYTKQHPFIIKALYGLEFVALENIQVEEVFRLINQLLPMSFCRNHQVLPIAKFSSHVLKVAIVEPNNAQIKQELEAFLATLREAAPIEKIKIEYFGIYQEDYQELVKKYNKKNKFPKDIEIEPEKALEQTLINIGEKIDEILDADIEEESPLLQRKISAEEAAIAELVERILTEAIEKKATQIEIYPINNAVKVQFEEDGIFYPRAEGLLSLDLLNKIISHLKNLADINTNSQPVKKTQQGRLRFRFNIRPVEFWLTISPEKVSLRLLNQNSSLNLGELVSEPVSHQNIQSLLKKPSGLIIVTGTNRLSIINTLYSFLSERNEPKVKIITVEEPVERIIPGLRQLEVNRNLQSDHAALLKALPSQEIDIIMIDDVSDPNVTKIALDLVIKGRLVLVGIQGQDCEEGITRLLNQDISASLLAEQLLGVIHHRYLRRLCAICRLSHTPTPEQKALFGLTNSKERATFYKANTLSKEGIEQAQSRGRLCRSCNGLGYRGLLDTYEVLTVTPSLKRVISQKPKPQFLAKAVQEEELKSSIGYALDLVNQGSTTLDEIDRIFVDKLQNYNPSPKPNLSPKSNPSTQGVSQRIENMENLVMGLLHELQQLKLAIGQPVESESVPTNPHSIPADPDPSKQTIASGSAFYEELIDPGEWDQLRNELNIDQDTIAVDFPDADERQQSRRSIPDPW